MRHSSGFLSAGPAPSSVRAAPPSVSPSSSTRSTRRLRAFLREFAKKHPRWGWRRAHDALRDEGHRVNHKKVQRLWREEGLKVPYRKKKKRLTGIGVQVGAMRPIAPNVIWAMDFQFDQTSDLRTIKMLNIIDEFTRECLAIDVGRSITADDVVNRLDQLAKERGAPCYVRMDNGPEFVAHALNDWCRFNGTGSLFIDPGLTLAERLDRIVQRSSSRRVLKRSTVRQSLRGEGAPRGLATRIQSRTEPTAHFVGKRRPGSPRPGSSGTSNDSQS